MSHHTARLYEQLSTLVVPTEPPSSQALGCVDLVAALRRFKECVRYLNTRRSKGAILNIQGEDDVQDALFLMLRIWVTDLAYENPTDRVANRFAIKDFLVPQARTVIEAKFIRDKSHARRVVSELNDDIENYRHHPLCDSIIFFIYDRDSLIPDVEQLRLAIETPRTYAGRALACHLIVQS